jgi:hypothetical protein
MITSCKKQDIVKEVGMWKKKIVSKKFEKKDLI